MVNKIIKALNNLGRGRSGEKGITGLETAIILIAFVTVAAVLGYSVLSAGIFSSEKGKAAVYQGLNQAQASMEVKGSVVADCTEAAGAVTLTDVKFTLASVLNDQDVDMTAPPNNTLIINYTDTEGNTDQDVTWTATPLGIHSTDTDNMLKPNEQMLMTVTPGTVSSGTVTPFSNLKPYDTFTIQIIPSTGAAITIQRTLPGLVSGPVDLN